MSAPAGMSPGQPVSARSRRPRLLRLLVPSGDDAHLQTWLGQERLSQATEAGAPSLSGRGSRCTSEPSFLGPRRREYPQTRRGPTPSAFASNAGPI
jgi:hypothetical protein